MRHAIVEKLDLLISNGIQTEAQVVYLLVEVRKLLEMQQRKHEFEALVFHCDWVVHAQLSGATAQYYLSHINRMQHSNVTGELHADEWEEVAPLIGAQRFHEDLRTVLRLEGISSAVCDEPSKWTSFMSLYGAVISDVPLTITRLRETKRAPKQLEVPKYIDRVTVEKLDLNPDEYEGAMFALQWNLHFAIEPERNKMAGWRMLFHPNV
jgi:hypothetical protein